MRTDVERRNRVPRDTLSRVAVTIVAVGSAAGAAATHAHPTATAASDLITALGVGAFAVVASSLAGPWAWLGASLVAAGASGDWAGAAGGASAASVIAVVTPRLPGRRVIGSIVGAVVVQTMLRLPPGQMGRDTLLFAGAMGGLAMTSWRSLGHSGRERLRRLAARVVILGGLAFAGLLLSLLLARNEVRVGIDRAQEGLDAARAGDSDRAADLLDSAHRAFRSAHRDLDAWWAKPALVLPVVGQHAEALSVVSEAGADLAQAAATSSRAARVQDLHVIDGHLDLDRVREVAAPLARIRTALSRAGDAVSSVDEAWLVRPVTARIDEFKRAVELASSEAATAAEAIAVVPDLLGGSGRRYYFVAFGTPAETRELGGFMGAYAVMVADDGDLRLASTGRVRDLNQAFRGRKLDDPSAFPAQYLALQPQRYFQNVTGTADFPTVAEAVAQMWPPSAGRFDGVLYMDPQTLADMLELTGPIRVPGYDKPLSAKTAAPFLLRQQYVEFPNDDRHDFLVDAAESVFKELTSGELPRPRVIADTMAPSVRQRRLLFNSIHPAEQALFERLGMDGALPPVRGDFLSVRSSNRGLSKIDAMVQRTVAYDVTVDPARGMVRSKVSVTIRNDAPSAGLPYNVIGNHVGQPSGTSSSTVSVYTPLKLVDVTQGGQPVGRGAYEEYDRFKYTALVDVPAGQTVTVVFELEGSMGLSHGYHLDILPQPLVNPDRLRVDVHGVERRRGHGTTLIVNKLREREEVDVPLVPLRF